jgi:hypothetical protein
MRRRTALASLAAAGTTALAGCAAAGTTTLTDPAVEADERSTVLRFTDGSGDPVATLALGHRLVPADGVNRFVTLRTSLAHPEDTDVRSLRYRLFHAGTAPQAHFSDAYVQEFGSEDLSSSFYRQVATGTPNGYVFDLRDTGIQGRGTMSIRFQGWVTDDPDTVPVGLAVRAEVDRTTFLGGSFDLDATTEFDATPR